MDDWVFGIYVDEVESQKRFALGAAMQLDPLLEIYSDPPPGADTRYLNTEIFRNIHSLLVHASNVSKLFWPTPAHGTAAEKTARDERGARLRAHYGLPDAHPLKDRTLRNHLEHFDERLDSWQRQSKDRNIVTDSIGPRSYLGPGFDDADIMRFYDETTGEFIFRGEPFDLKVLIAILQQLVPGGSQPGGG
jgi:hypothetical protein